MRARALCRTYCRRALLGAALALTACNLHNPGDEPLRGALYFTNALALSPHEPGTAARYLFAANSNFDLRYKTGSVQAFSLERLDEAIESDDCTGDEPCAFDDTASILEDEVLVSSFATALATSADGRFLFVTTRTDESLSFVRLDSDADGDDVLDCGTGDRRCDLYAARARDPEDLSQPLTWPNDPAAVTSGPLSDWSGNSDDDSLYVMVAHRGGEVSLFIEQPSEPENEAGRFELRSVLQRLTPPLTNVGFDPSTGLAHLTTGAAGVASVGVVPPQEDDGRGSLYYAGAIRMQSLVGAPDARDLAFLPAVSNAGQALSEDSALIVATEPSALLLADVDESRNGPGRGRVKRTAVVGAGASRLAAGVVGGRATAVVACFDARALFVIDLETMLTVSVVPNLSGPFDIVLDEERERLYVADFRSSVIRVVDLSRLADSQGERAATVIATVGMPRVIQELR